LRLCLFYWKCGNYITFSGNYVTTKKYLYNIRGRDKYNISLSERRGKAVTDYIISNGIDASIIESKYFGETQIFNEGNKNIEIEYALNRRSNVVIVISK